MTGTAQQTAPTIIAIAPQVLRAPADLVAARATWACLVTGATEAATAGETEARAAGDSEAGKAGENIGAGEIVQPKRLKVKRARAAATPKGVHFSRNRQKRFIRNRPS
jgi:hypothetical protein